MRKGEIAIEDTQNMYQIYANDVKRFLICLTNQYDLAEELTQETFYQAYKSIHRYNGNCKLSVWLCQIAKHLFYDYLKKNRVAVVSIDENLDWIETSHLSNQNPEKQLILRESANEILEEVNQLKELQRKVFLLRTLGELEFREIGEIFEKSDNWARVTYYRAKSTLIERLKRYENNM